jgi:hypothetical protein
MRVHVDVLGWLHVLVGACGLLTGTSLEILASGTSEALSGMTARPGLSSPTVWLLILGGAALLVAGAVLMLVGRALIRRRRFAREAALILAFPNLLVVPFGTALGIYSFWTLMNDEARVEFGRPPRAPDTIRT